MNTKSILLIIALIAVVSIYGLIYAAMTTIIMPSDSEAFKNELSTLETPIVNDTSVAEIESSAASMNYISLTQIPASERAKVANSMRFSNAFTPDLNQNFGGYDTITSYKMVVYDLIFRGDISDEMENLTTTRNKITAKNNETVTIIKRMPDEMEKGDTNAYVGDIRNLANNKNDYDNLMTQYKNQLKKIIQLTGG